MKKILGLLTTFILVNSTTNLIISTNFMSTKINNNQIKDTKVIEAAAALLLPAIGESKTDGSTLTNKNSKEDSMPLIWDTINTIIPTLYDKAQQLPNIGEEVVRFLKSLESSNFYAPNPYDKLTVGDNTLDIEMKVDYPGSVGADTLLTNVATGKRISS